MRAERWAFTTSHNRSLQDVSLNYDHELVLKHDAIMHQ